MPKELDLRLTLDNNYTTHRHPKGRQRLAEGPRWHLHFTPTYSNWLSQVEPWFGLITQQAIRRGSFGSVKDLVRSIEHYVQQYNRHKHPFVWTATAELILAKVQRLCKIICRTEH